MWPRDCWILTLKVAGLVLCIARESDLWRLVLELLNDLRICHVAHLEVFLDDERLLVTDCALLRTVLVRQEHCPTCVVRLAHIAVDAAPSIVAFAGVDIIGPRLALVAIRQGAAEGHAAVVAAEAWWARAFAVVLVAFRELAADVGVGVAIEAGGAGRAAVGPVIEERAVGAPGEAGVRGITVCAGEPWRAEEPAQQPADLAWPHVRTWGREGARDQ